MANNDFSISVLVDAKAGEVFSAIKNVRGWWSGLYGEEFNGTSEKINDEFVYTAGEGQHYSKQKLIELVPDKKIVWEVIDSKLTFLKDRSEWTNTRLSFEISNEAGKTRIRFTHIGLVPSVECYETCSSVWPKYIQEKLVSVIENQKNKVIG